MMRRIRGGWTLLLLLAGCGPGPGLDALVPRQQLEDEALAGTRAATILESRFGGVQRDAAGEARLQRVGARLESGVPELARDYRFRILRSAEMNAFALPVGRIYVTSGLYRQIERDDLLAATLAHEMAHLSAGDCFKGLCSNEEDVLDRELSADRRGAEYLAAAGYPPEAMTELIQLVCPALPEGWCARRCTNLAATGPAPEQGNLAGAGPGRQVQARSLAGP